MESPSRNHLPGGGEPVKPRRLFLHHITAATGEKEWGLQKKPSLSQGKRNSSDLCLPGTVARREKVKTGGMSQSLGGENQAL